MRFLPGVSVGSLVVGAGVVLLVPIVLPVVGCVLKSAAKAVIKGGVVIYEGTKATIAESQEAIKEAAAEAKAEVSR